MTKYVVIRDCNVASSKLDVGGRIDLDKDDIVYLTKTFNHKTYGHKIYVFSFGPYNIHLLEHEIKDTFQPLIQYNDIWNELNG